MKKFFIKPFRWAICMSLILTIFFAYVMLDTFVIPKSVSVVATNSSTGTTTALSKTATNSSSTASTDAVITDNSYQDDNISISINTVTKYDSTVYIADIQVSDVSYLQAAFANNTYGQNIKETTSSMATSNNAIFAINGDYYGFRNYGYVYRNGTLYRDTAGDSEDLVVSSDGTFSILDESTTDVNSLDLSSIWQIFSFGPALVNKGKIVVDDSSEVSQSMGNTNPRTAIGMISPLHYIVVVVDGRTSESAGVTLSELAQIMKNQGCTVAYNLDGGGSTTMYFNGKVVNVPTDGRSNGEREVSDIVYIGY